jgi:ribosome-associated toxin RatA of RatAB toxin-antitoxin module
MVAILLLALATGATDANALLAKGPLVSVERGSDGKFSRCTALILINAPPEKVWATITDYEHLQDFVPKVVKSEVVQKNETTTDVKLEIDTPGANTKYVVRHTPHLDTKTLDITWVSGDLKGTAWTFHLEPTPEGGTLLSYSGSSRHFSRVLESLEDDQQTITIGVNVGAALTTVNAMKSRAEGK